MTADNTTIPPSPHPEGVIEEFRINDVFCRVVKNPSSEDPDDVGFIFAGSAKGLDSADALRPADVGDLRNAIKMACEAAWLTFSATMSEEATYNREAIRLGMQGIHSDPRDSTRAVPLEPCREGDAPPTDPDGPFEVRFTVDGMAGRIFGESRAETAWMNFELARHELDLGTPAALQPATFTQVMKVVHIASTLMDLSTEGIDPAEAAVGYRHLMRIGMKLLTSE